MTTDAMLREALALNGIRVFANEFAVRAVRHPETRVRGGYMNRWLLRKPGWVEYRPAAYFANGELFVHPTLLTKMREQLR